mmetsp:Transcript_41673/g.48302  ORF Transcript_41673/g.48302 Transcript_41673/m.48302 type:complete len:305 (+) Transcript_41673:184-1098(+)
MTNSAIAWMAVTNQELQLALYKLETTQRGGFNVQTQLTRRKKYFTALSMMVFVIAATARMSTTLPICAQTHAPRPSKRQRESVRSAKQFVRKVSKPATSLFKNHGPSGMNFERKQQTNSQTSPDSTQKFWKLRTRKNVPKHWNSKLVRRSKKKVKLPLRFGRMNNLQRRSLQRKIVSSTRNQRKTAKLFVRSGAKQQIVQQQESGNLQKTRSAMLSCRTVTVDSVNVLTRKRVLKFGLILIVVTSHCDAAMFVDTMVQNQKPLRLSKRRHSQSTTVPSSIFPKLQLHDKPFERKGGSVTTPTTS